MSFTSFIIFTSIMTRSNFYFETFVHFTAIHMKFMEKEAGNRNKKTDCEKVKVLPCRAKKRETEKKYMGKRIKYKANYISVRVHSTIWHIQFVQ